MRAAVSHCRSARGEERTPTVWIVAGRQGTRGLNNNLVTLLEKHGIRHRVVRNQSGVVLRAFEASNNPNVKSHDLITVCIGANCEISSVINNSGGATTPNVRLTPKVTNIP